MSEDDKEWMDKIDFSDMDRESQDKFMHSLIKRIEALEQEFKRCMKDITLSLNNNFKDKQKIKEVLRDIISLTIPNHLKKELYKKLDNKESEEKDD